MATLTPKRRDRHPVAALDKALRQRMQVELRALQQQVGITTVFVTHDQDEGPHHGRSHRGDEPRSDRAGGHAGRDLRVTAERVRAGLARSRELLPATVVAAGSDGIRARSAGGLELLSAHPAGPSKGALVVGIRPELLLDGETAGRANVYPADPLTTVFHGAFVEHHLRLRETGDVVVVQSAAGPAVDGRPGPDGIVRVHFPPEAVLRVSP